MARQRGARARAPRPASFGTEPYDALVGVVAEIVRREMEPLMPRLGTVKGRDGQRVIVEPWGEGSGGRREAHARKAGSNPKDNDTVILIPTGDGNFVAVDIVEDGGRPDRIGADEIERDAIDERHLKQNAVKGRHIEANSIGDREIGRNFINRSMLEGSFANSLADMGQVDRLDKRIDGMKALIDNLRDRVGQD